MTNEMVISENAELKTLKKHNNLIISKYTLEPSEQKLLYKLIEHVQKNNYETQRMHISFDDFLKEFKGVISKKITRTDFKKLILGLQRKVPQIVCYETNSLISTQWFRVIGDIDFNEIVLELDDYFFMYIKNHKKTFTLIDTASVYNMKRFHSMRVYELAKQWCSKEANFSKYFELNMLKSYLDVESKKGYNDVTNFKKRVLETSVKEINEVSDILLSIEDKRRNRKIVGFTFKMKKKPQATNKSKGLGKSDNESPDGESNDPVVVSKVCICPAETYLTEAARKRLNYMFGGYDFTTPELSMVFFDTEDAVRSQKNIDKIDKEHMSYFMAILNNKLAQIEEKQVAKEKQNPAPGKRKEDSFAGNIVIEEVTSELEGC